MRQGDIEQFFLTIVKLDYIVPPELLIFPENNCGYIETTLSRQPEGKRTLE